MLLSCHVALWEIKENRETLKWPTEGKLCWHKKKCPPLSLQRVRSARVRTLRCLAKVSTLGTVHIMVTNGQVSTEKGLARCSELTTYLAALLSHCLMALTMHPHHSNRLVAQALKAVQQVLSGCKQYPTLMLMLSAGPSHPNQCSLHHICILCCATQGAWLPENIWKCLPCCPPYKSVASLWHHPHYWDCQPWHWFWKRSSVVSCTGHVLFLSSHFWALAYAPGHRNCNEYNPVVEATHLFWLFPTYFLKFEVGGTCLQLWPIMSAQLYSNILGLNIAQGNEDAAR